MNNTVKAQSPTLLKPGAVNIAAPGVARFLAAINRYFCVYSEEFAELWSNFQVQEVVGWENRYAAVPDSGARADAFGGLAPRLVRESLAFLSWEDGLRVRFEGRLAAYPLDLCVPRWRKFLPVIHNHDLCTVTEQALFVPVRLIDPAALRERSLFEQQDIARAIQSKLRRALMQGV